MDLHEFIRRYSDLSEDRKKIVMAQVFGMFKALNDLDLLESALEDAEKK